MKDIRFVKVNKCFGEKRVFTDFDAEFPAESATAVMGPSGTGKTTLINLMMGLTAPDAGVIEGLDGERFSCVFQEDRLAESESAMTNIGIIFTGPVPDSAIAAELKAVGLAEEDLSGPVSRFSGGMKRRVAIVRALIADSDTVILDEPFKGLDEGLKETVMNYVEDRIGTRRLILVTHEKSEAVRLCERTIELR